MQSASAEPPSPAKEAPNSSPYQYKDPTSNKYVIKYDQENSLQGGINIIAQPRNIQAAEDDITDSIDVFMLADK